MAGIVLWNLLLALTFDSLLDVTRQRHELLCRLWLLFRCGCWSVDESWYVPASISSSCAGLC